MVYTDKSDEVTTHRGQQVVAETELLLAKQYTSEDRIYSYISALEEKFSEDNPSSWYSIGKYLQTKKDNQ